MIQGTTMQIGSKKQANVVFKNGSKELSLAIDNGPRAHTEKLYRSDIRCFNGDKDVTAQVFGCREGDIVPGDVKNMAKGMNWLQLNVSPYTR